ncbi:hypothetical protein [Staphylococcus pseudintermedius]|uniref:hypothetical protein n=1 Tax=Staphylococcus pseudintermedius TaxID=283734 RepID=UPI003F66C0DA
MNIKVKKEMNLLELIEYIKKNEIADKVFLNKKGKGKVVVGDDRHLYMSDLNLTDTFTVEVEEVITDKTVIPNLLVTYQFDGISVLEIRKDKSIKYLLDLDEYSEVTIKALHTVNDDSTHTLIWKDGKLV